MVRKASEDLVAARRSTGLTAFEIEGGRHFNTFISAPQYVDDSQPASEDKVALGRDLRHHLGMAQLTVRNFPPIFEINYRNYGSFLNN